jgi:hypothetical protein
MVHTHLAVSILILLVLLAGTWVINVPQQERVMRADRRLEAEKQESGDRQSEASGALD